MTQQFTIRIGIDSSPCSLDEKLIAYQQKAPLDKRKVVTASVVLATVVYLLFAMFTIEPAVVPVVSVEHSKTLEAVQVIPQRTPQQQAKPQLPIVVQKSAAIITEKAKNSANVSAYDRHIKRSLLTSKIVNREPVDDLGDNILVNDTNSKQLYFFTEIVGLSGQTIYHQWRYKGELMAELELPVGSDRWRTYSSKRIGAHLTGKWVIDVLDNQGNVIASKAFTCR
jgi:hypothetical protein